MVKIIFHKEPERIGGGITEIICDANGKTSHLFIDMGADMDKGFDYDEPNPNVDGLTVGDMHKEVAILITHGHLDHVGLLKYAYPGIPVYMSEMTKKILHYGNGQAATFLGRVMKHVHTISYQEFEQPFYPCLGFKVTPIRVDHSAFDSLAYFIEAEDKAILFTGDYREHGYTGHLVRQLLGDYAKKANVVITEGTHVVEDPQMIEDRVEIISEYELEKRFETLCCCYKYILYMGSSTNIDSIVSMAWAARNTNKSFSYVDSYSYSLAEEILFDSPFDYKFVKLNPYNKAYYDEWRAKERDKDRGRVVICRMNNIEYIRNFFEKYGKDTVLVYSMWEGYIEDNPELEQLQRDLGPKFVKLHSSGHASKELVQYVINSNPEAAIIPMHTESFGPWDEICEYPQRLVKLHKGDYYRV